MKIRTLLLAAALAAPAAGAQLGTVHLRPEAYGTGAVASLPRESILRILTPAGDTIYLGNVPDSLKKDCVPHTRLRVLVNSGPVTDYIAREPGRGALTPGFRIPTPSGETLVIEEIYRRKITCDPGDGFLVLWLSLLGPGASAKS